MSDPTVVLDLDGKFLALMNERGEMLKNVKFASVDTHDEQDVVTGRGIRVQRLGFSPSRSQILAHVFDHSSLVSSTQPPVTDSEEDAMDFSDNSSAQRSDYARQLRQWAGRFHWSGAYNQPTNNRTLLSHGMDPAPGYTLGEMAALDETLYIPVIPPRFLATDYHDWFPDTRYYTLREGEETRLPHLTSDLPSLPRSLNQIAVATAITSHLNHCRSSASNLPYRQEGYEVVPDFVNSSYRWVRTRPRSRSRPRERMWL